MRIVFVVIEKNCIKFFTIDTKNILNFSSTGYITGANVIDGLLFFTDNTSEPKKINICLNPW